MHAVSGGGGIADFEFLCRLIGCSVVARRIGEAACDV